VNFPPGQRVTIENVVRPVPSGKCGQLWKVECCREQGRRTPGHIARHGHSLVEALVPGPSDHRAGDTHPGVTRSGLVVGVGIDLNPILAIAASRSKNDCGAENYLVISERRGDA
jgi:hypothetical protein